MALGAAGRKFHVVRRSTAPAKEAEIQSGAADAQVSETSVWLAVLLAFLKALPDIFSSPPVETTGPAAPGLKEIGTPVSEALSNCTLVNVRNDEQIAASSLSSLTKVALWLSSF